MKRQKINKRKMVLVDEKIHELFEKNSKARKHGFT